MSDAVELLLPPDTQHVGLARLVVVTAARRAGMDEGRVQDLRIAVSEATTNAILAHQRTSSSDRITLRFRDTGAGAFQVTITDAGSQAGPDSVQASEDGAWPAEGGLGITLLEGLADEVEFVRGEGAAVQLRFVMSLGDEDDG
jgi:serine/threonine-protein kinase RsbW